MAGSSAIVVCCLRLSSFMVKIFGKSRNLEGKADLPPTYFIMSNSAQSSAMMLVLFLCASLVPTLAVMLLHVIEEAKKEEEGTMKG